MTQDKKQDWNPSRLFSHPPGGWRYEAAMIGVRYDEDGNPTEILDAPDFVAEAIQHLITQGKD